MKKIVILLAGGNGSRFGTEIPKQFIVVNGKPIIIHTLLKVQKQNVDHIIIVCVDEWKKHLTDLLKQYDIQKVFSVVSGGLTGHDSIFNGLKEAKKIAHSNDIIVFHDSVRPLITKSCFDDVIEKAMHHNAACASTNITEGLVIRSTEEYGLKLGDRYNTVRVQTPQAYKFKIIFDIYRRANETGTKYPYADSACILNGVPLYFSKSFVSNLKITTKSDIAFFKALCNFSEDELNGDI